MTVLDTVVALYNAGREALAGKRIDLTDNTLTGTTAQFNAANTDADFYTTGGGDVAIADGGTGVSTLPAGLLKGAGTGAITAAASGTDYAPATSGSGVLKGSGSGGFSSAAAGTDYVAPGGALGTPSSGVVTNCTGVVPDSELTVGENTFTRLLNNTSTNTLTNGLLRLTFFTARKTESCSQVRTRTGAQAQVGATLCRIGIYTVDASDNLTALVASTTNDTALWSAGSTTYTKALTASFTKTRGQRYAVGLLEVGSSTAANAFGTVGPEANEAAQVPRLSGTVSSLSDLPSSGSPVVAVGSLTASNFLMYSALLP